MKKIIVPIVVVGVLAVGVLAVFQNTGTEKSSLSETKDMMIDNTNQVTEDISEDKMDSSDNSESMMDDSMDDSMDDTTEMANGEEVEVNIETVEGEVQNEQVTEEVVEEVTLANGEYVDYSEAALASANDMKILFFHADWCPTCRATEKEIIEKGLPNNVSVLKVDYDEATDLKKKYEVVSQTTFVMVDAEGNMIKKWLGGGVDGIIESIN